MLHKYHLKNALTEAANDLLNSKRYAKCHRTSVENGFNIKSTYSYAVKASKYSNFWSTAFEKVL